MVEMMLVEDEVMERELLSMLSREAQAQRGSTISLPVSELVEIVGIAPRDVIDKLADAGLVVRYWRDGAAGYDRSQLAGLGFESLGEIEVDVLATELRNVAAALL